MPMHMMTDPRHRRDDSALRARNLRTAAVLFGIALAFFAGVIVSKSMGGYVVGMGIVGVAILVFLVLAIGRNIRGD